MLGPAISPYNVFTAALVVLFFLPITIKLLLKLTLDSAIGAWLFTLLFSLITATLIAFGVLL